MTIPASPIQLRRMVPERHDWNEFVRSQNGHILQTGEWGDLKSAFGWSQEIVPLGSDDSVVTGALMLFRPLPLGLGSIAYVPRGPVVDWADKTQVAQLLAALDKIARSRGAVFLKVEPDQPDEAGMRALLGHHGFKPSPHSVQPTRTIVVDVSADDEEHILMKMSQSTRRKVRLGLRREVVVRQGDASDLASFNALMASTSTRGAFGVHSPEYYDMVFDLFAPDHAVLLIASFEGIDLAGLMTFALGDTAWYFYGASRDRERQRMPSYALQWEAIRWARERGCKQYDLWGVPDLDEDVLEDQFQNRNDGLWGPYGFKRGFGGEVVRSVGSWDRVYNPLLYRVYKLAMTRRVSGE